MFFIFLGVLKQFVANLWAPNPDRSWSPGRLNLFGVSRVRAEGSCGGFEGSSGLLGGFEGFRV